MIFLIILVLLGIILFRVNYKNTEHSPQKSFDSKVIKKDFDYHESHRKYDENISTIGDYLNITFTKYWMDQVVTEPKDILTNDFNRISTLLYAYRYTHDESDKFLGITQAVRVTCKKHGLFVVDKAIMYLDGVGCPECFIENGEYPKSILSMTVHEIKQKFNTDTEYAMYLKENLSRILKPLKDSFKVEHAKNVEYQKDIYKYTKDYFEQKLTKKQIESMTNKINKSSDSDYLKYVKHRAGERLNSYTKCVNKLLKTKIDCFKDEESIKKIIDVYADYSFERSLNYPKQDAPIKLSGSKGEFDTFIFLLKNKIGFVRELSFLDAPRISNLRYDFFIPKYNLIIEIHGNQHFEVVKHWGGEEGLKKRVERDNMKKTFIETIGLNYIAIHHKDWGQIESILESKINTFTNT